jgi:hypothetical protein
MTTDLTREDAPVLSVGRGLLSGGVSPALLHADARERARLVGKLMREARDPDVWQFVTPREVWGDYSASSCGHLHDRSIDRSASMRVSSGFAELRGLSP